MLLCSALARACSNQVASQLEHKLWRLGQKTIGPWGSSVYSPRTGWARSVSISFNYSLACYIIELESGGKALESTKLFDLSGRVAVVTGGNGGIGRSIALADG